MVPCTRRKAHHCDLLINLIIRAVAQNGLGSFIFCVNQNLMLFFDSIGVKIPNEIKHFGTFDFPQTIVEIFHRLKLQKSKPSLLSYRDGVAHSLIILKSFQPKQVIVKQGIHSLGKYREEICLDLKRLVRIFKKTSQMFLFW
jgi:hypothetical protein